MLILIVNMSCTEQLLERAVPVWDKLNSVMAKANIKEGRGLTSV